VLLIVGSSIFLISCDEQEVNEHVVEAATLEVKPDVIEESVEAEEVSLPPKFVPKPVDRFNDEYDVHFKKYSKRYFGPVMDYRWFKSQAMAESNLDPKAQSPVGAKGIMQIMDPTYAEIQQKNKEVIGNVYEARWNIHAGIYYNRTLYNQWTSPRPELDRLALTFASYNAGLGNILKSQKECNRVKHKECNLWNNIKIFGPVINTWKEEETIHYVTKIHRFMGYEGY
jgi:membrane-bound lytic murein transglycosylase F